jgi:hypothetical protein
MKFLKNAKQPPGKNERGGLDKKSKAQKKRIKRHELQSNGRCAGESFFRNYQKSSKMTKVTGDVIGMGKRIIE